MKTEKKRAIRPKGVIVRCIAYEYADWILRVLIVWLLELKMWKMEA